MIRKSTLNISMSNKTKTDCLDSIFEESKSVINSFIDKLWELKDFSSKFVSFKVDTWLSSRMQQCLGKQALEIVKSQRKRAKKTKPVFTKNTIELDSRFVDILESDNSFDLWIKLSSIGNKIKLFLPTNKHFHFNKFSNWKMKKSVKLKCLHGKYFVDIYFEKDAPAIKKAGESKAVDIGYKKLIVSSDGEFIGSSAIYEKISRKKQGSKAFKRALIERDGIINKSCKTLNLENTKTLYAEDLKDVKKNSKGKVRKFFNNKLQRWSYSKVLNKLSALCEEKGIKFVKLNPQYTSQRCSNCGVIHKDNRQGELYICTTCGMKMDADLNASINILHLGEYGPQAFKPNTIKYQ